MSKKPQREEYAHRASLPILPKMEKALFKETWAKKLIGQWEEYAQRASLPFLPEKTRESFI